jgi:acetoin utilization protein AcuB
MSTDVLSVDPETDVGEVVDLMIEHRVGAVPVVDADSEELVGIVSYMDVLRASRDLL